MNQEIIPSIHLLFSITKKFHSIEKKFSRLFKEINISPQQFYFIYLVNYFIEEKEVAYSIDIMNYMGVERAAISRLGMRIEEEGLIKRISNNTKKVQFELTTKGKKTLILALNLIDKDIKKNPKENSNAQKIASAIDLIP